MTDWARVQERLTKSEFSTSRILLGLDFDGTLSEIVDSPEEATLAPDTRRLLKALTRRNDIKVAILSGRALEDLKKRIGLPDIYYVGNHGLQIDGPGLRWSHPRVDELDPSCWKALEKSLKDIPGVFIEYKRLGMAVHYRKVPATYIRPLEEQVRTRFPGIGGKFRILRSKKTYDIRSSVFWNKGHALKRIRNQLRGHWISVFIGDDRTDEEGFRTLGARALTIRVGRSTVSQAQYIFTKRKQVDHLLKLLGARSSPLREA